MKTTYKQPRDGIAQQAGSCSIPRLAQRGLMAFATPLLPSHCISGASGGGRGVVSGLLTHARWPWVASGHPAGGKSRDCIALGEMVRPARIEEASQTRGAMHSGASYVGLFTRVP
jgi:hypothetical protein